MKLTSFLRLSLLCAALACVGDARLHAQTAAKLEVAGISFTVPAAWETAPTASAMRKAQYRIKDAAGKESGDVVFFLFPAGEAGSVAANVDRWLGKFTEPREKINAKTESLTVGKSKVTYVQAEGTYDTSMPGSAPAPVPNFGLLGAIVETSEGNIFIRLTAPKALAKSAQPEFRKMVESGLKGK